MTIDATFWVAVSFFIFCGLLIYLKVPNKINLSLINQINEIKKEIENAERIKIEAKNILSNYESKLEKSNKEVKNIISSAQKNSEINILEKTKKFHHQIENKKKNAEQKIIQMKENAIKEIKNISVDISFKAVENIIRNSIDKNKIEKIYLKSLDQTKIALKKVKY